MHQLPPDLPLGLVTLLVPVLDGRIDRLEIDENGVADLVLEALEDSLAFGTVRIRITNGDIVGEARSLLIRTPPVIVTPRLVDGGRLVLHGRSALPIRGVLAKAQRRCDTIVEVLGEQGRTVEYLRVDEGRLELALAPWEPRTSSKRGPRATTL